MKKQNGLFYLIGLSAALGLCLVPGTVGAQNIAWDMVSSTSQGLLSYSTDAPVFTSPGDGFQKYMAVPQSCPPPPDPNVNNIPFTLIDDSACIYEADALGFIDSMTDFDMFFGACDTVNDADNPNADPYHATWVFDISSAAGEVTLRLDLAAMGNFELEHTVPPDPFETTEDSFIWTYQVDSGAVQTFLTSDVDEDGTMTYIMASGTVVELDDPLVVNGTTLSNFFRTFSTPITTGSQLTVVLTATVDGSSEGYAVRDIVVSNYAPGQGGGQPIPTLSMVGVAAMVLMLMAGAVFLFRRFR